MQAALLRYSAVTCVPYHLSFPPSPQPDAQLGTSASSSRTYSSKTTHVTCPPGIAYFATGVNSPVVTALSKTTTWPSPWVPTATSVPAPLMENCRGISPPVPTVWTTESAPVAASTRKVMSGSPGLGVALSPREVTRRNLLSGFDSSR